MEKESREESLVSLFIPSEKLGVLEGLIRAIGTEQTKRKRRNRASELAGLLHKLGLVPHAAQVRALGLGHDLAGQSGALVILDPLTRVHPAGGIHGRPQGETEVPR